MTTQKVKKELSKIIVDIIACHDDHFIVKTKCCNVQIVRPFYKYKFCPLCGNKWEGLERIRPIAFTVKQSERIVHKLCELYDFK